jgi:glycosyltransferase involved in cell wall biosynthesis
MKIVIGTESFSPNVSGVAVFAERIASYMAKSGHEVYVFAPSPNSKTFFDPKFRDYKVLRLRSIPNPFRSGFRVTWRPGAEIERRIREIKPDVIHLQDPTSICTGLVHVANKNKIPVVITNHFSLDFIASYIKFLGPFIPLAEKILVWRFRKFYDSCTVVTTPSETARGKILGWGIKNKVIVLSNGVDLERFHPGDRDAAKEKLKLSSEPVVLYTGRVDVDKSVQVMIKAIPFVLKEVTAHFVFVGSGDSVQKMKALAGELGIDKSITFTGYVPNVAADFPLYYQAADIFASASTIETQSIVMLEALASGLPFVVARGGSFPEFIRNGENGFLFNPGDSKEMAAEISKILKDQALQKKMGERSLEVASHHPLQKTYQEFEALYKSLSQKSGS